jgi:hypothetical protein
LLDRQFAAHFVGIALDTIGREWPFKMDLVMAGPEDARPPRDFHPIFHGSFDWHSCVHSWWQMLRLARRFPDLPQAAAIRARADAMLVPDKVAGEIAFFDRPTSATASRPYGWAWLLALHHEAAQHDAPWGDALAPLAARLASGLRAYLPKLTYPIRVGTHFNSSFALILARRWAETRDAALLTLIDDRARDWFLGDRDCQAWEPGGDEFLSSALTQALLMQRVLPSEDFAAWFAAFLPRLDRGEPATLFTPAHVSDRTDGKIAHLDGLNLSRAWCWREIAPALPPDDARRTIALEAAEVHLDAALPHVTGDYMGEHWLASFALLALLAADD